MNKDETIQDDELDNNDILVDKLDNEFKGYIDNTFNTNKKNKTNNFSQNDKVQWKDDCVTILYGPYMNGLRQMYECVLSDGTVQPIAGSSLGNKIK